MNKNSKHQVTELVKKRLLEQPIEHFETILKFATTLAGDTEESTNSAIMTIIGKADKKPVSYELDMEFIDDGAPEVDSTSPRRGNPEQVARELNSDEAEGRDILSEMEKGNNQSHLQRNVDCDEEEQIRFMPFNANLRNHERILGPDSGGMFCSLRQLPLASDLTQENQLHEDSLELIRQSTAGENSGELAMHDTKVATDNETKRRENGIRNTHAQLVQELPPKAVVTNVEPKNQRRQKMSSSFVNVTPPSSTETSLIEEIPMGWNYEKDVEMKEFKEDIKDSESEMEIIKQIDERDGDIQKAFLKPDYFLYNIRKLSYFPVIPNPEKKEEVKVVEQNKRKGKKKKEKGLEKEYMAGETDLSKKSLNDILRELGETVSVEQKGSTGKNRRKKSKENQKQPQQSLVQGSEKTKTELKKDAKKDKKGNKMEDDGVAAPIHSKRSSSGVAGSWEDAEEEFLSADEDMGSSNSRLTTPPTEFVDARTTTSNRTSSPQNAQKESFGDVMLDPSNYRDDGDVEQLAKQLKNEEDEFITVGSKNSKKKQQQPQQPQQKQNSPANVRRGTQLTSSNSEDHGGERHGHGQGRRFSGGKPGGVGRPQAALTISLSDYIDNSKKETHKNQKHKKSAGGSYHCQPKKEDELLFSDAREVASPIMVNTKETPQPAFSYADAAKKSSGENTPLHELSPAPVPTTSVSSNNSGAPVISENGSPLSGVQLPRETSERPSSTADDVTFGYDEKLDEKEAKNRTSPVAHNSNTESIQRAENGDFVLNIGGRKLCIGKELNRGSTDPRNTVLINQLQEGWKKFIAGKPPLVYKSGQHAGKE